MLNIDEGILKMLKSQDDHYVSQTYLKQFIDLSNPGYLNVYRKAYPTKSKPRTPRSICYEPDGDSNPYFPMNPRILDDFLKLIEPQWEKIITEIENEDFNFNNKLLISLYVAYLRSCGFTAKRLGKSLMEEELELFRPFLAENVRENIEDHENGIDLINGLLSPDIKIVFDRDYVHAFAIKNLVHVGTTYHNLPWIIIKNNSSKPFITSDNPAILIYYPDKWYPDTYVPLTPTLSILIPGDPYHKFIGKNLPSKITIAGVESVEIFNCEIVKFAEDKIISSLKDDWIRDMVQKYRNWRVESVSVKISESDKECLYQLSQKAVEVIKK